jgi:excisionase family DNA binding protein
MENKFIVISENDLRVLLTEVLKDILDQRSVQVQNDQVLLNVQEAAALLNLAVPTLYEKTSSRLIPHYKHGKKLMFKKSELLAWIEGQKIKTLKEIRAEAVNYLANKNKV